MEEYELCVGGVVGLHFGGDRDADREGSMRDVYFFSFLFCFISFYCSLRGITEGIERESHEDRGMKDMMEAVRMTSGAGLRLDNHPPLLNEMDPIFVLKS